MSMMKRKDGSKSPRGLWDNIRAKKARGETMRKPGSKGAPTIKQLRKASNGNVNRAVPDSYKTYHTQAKNHLLNQAIQISKYGEQMPAQPSFNDYQYDMAKRHGVEPPKEVDA